jgi:uncharacterized protein (UPF0261 family)
MSTVVIIGALDTKGGELAYLADAIAAHGHRPLVVDVGVLGTPAFTPAISRAIRSRGKNPASLNTSSPL